jgi:Raf kinase inhibitor-like YbhB/YbcL family protein
VSRRRLLPLVLALVLSTAVVACSDSDGRSLPPPAPDQTTTTPSTPVIDSPDSEDLTLTSPSFVDGGVIPVDFTCTGAGLSPDLAWTGTPGDAAELALVVRDRTANGYLHWVVSGIDPALVGFGRDGVPEGTVQATNGAGVIGWTPPCPAAASGPHSYELTLHALPGTLAIEPGADGATAADLIEQASVEQASLTVTYAVG